MVLAKALISDFVVTKHAITRAQQRGITNESIHLTLIYGEKSWGIDGMLIKCTKRSRVQMKNKGICNHSIERACKTIAVVKDNCVVTIIPKGSVERHSRRLRRVHRSH